ncbi:MAG: thioredoxin family protein [Spirochaetia bacterium]|nr:thioredoxin family protein [Spirochaetia bacterium]
MTIKILGGGCPKCKKLYENVEKALKSTGAAADIEKVTDMKDIMSYNVISTPALVIDEQVVSTGKVLKPEQIAAKL